MACMSHGSASRLAINGTEIGFVQFQDMSAQGVVDDSAQVIDGNLDPHTGNILKGIKNVGCQIVLDPGNGELDVILPLIGLAESPGNTYTSGNVLPSFPVVVDMGEKVLTYTDCQVDMSVLQGQKGSSPIRNVLRLRGVDITVGNSGTFNPTNPLIVPAPYAFTMGVATLASIATQHNQFALAINNNLIVEHNNSNTATCIKPGAREITLSLSAPFNTTTAPLFTTPWGSGGSIKAAGVLAFTNGSVSSTITCGELSAIPRPPSRITKMTEIRLPLTYKVARTPSAAALTWVSVNA